ncbi:MAG TPA: hypothetical protein VIW24_28505 [Aldersonia sp.]
MGQLAFFSAESVPPAVSDLAGLLAGTGHAVRTRDGARISVVVGERWRAEALAAFIEETGVRTRVADTDEGRRLVRTDADVVLAPLVEDWTKGAVKHVPDGWTPNARELRMWALASGRGECDGERFVLGLDPHAPETHAPLALSLMRAGIAPTLIGTRGVSPGLRISGRRRLARLGENIGDPPPGAGVDLGWPRT